MLQQEVAGSQVCGCTRPPRPKAAHLTGNWTSQRRTAGLLARWSSHRTSTPGVAGNAM